MRAESSRRNLIKTLLGSALIGSTGCLSSDDVGISGDQSATLELTSTPVMANTLADEYLKEVGEIHWTRFAIGYSTEYKQSMIDELVSTGEITTLEWKLTYRAEFGPDSRSVPLFISDGGNYYEVSLQETSTVDRELWEFYLDLVNEAPSASDSVVSEPFEDVSAYDKRILEEAVNQTGNRGEVSDQGDGDFGTRGVEFHDDLNPDRSDLVPNPPMDLVAAEIGGDEYHFIPRADRGTMTLDQYTFSCEQVASSKSALEAYARETLPHARMSSSSVSDSEREILDAVTSKQDGYQYAEEPPASESLESILEPLGITQYLKDYEEYSEQTLFAFSIAEYEGQWYEFEFVVNP